MQSTTGVLSDVSFDLISALQNTLEAVTIYDTYIDDCEEAGDDQCRQLFEELKGEEARQAGRLRQELERLVREGKFQ
jgi:rubrerythrin